MGAVVTRIATPRTARLGLWTSVLCAVSVLLACGSDASVATPGGPPTASPEAVGAASSGASPGTPPAAATAVTVGADYAPPSDSVASTGAHLPANGRPTLVFVDAIW
ncbi:MAG: hypothetical protein WD734_05125 [Dehalococcoidia bacterium]